MKLYKYLLILVFAPFCVFAQLPDPWKPTGPNLFPVNVSGQVNGIGRICQMRFHPTKSDVVYAVSASGGLWISNDKGYNWTSMGTDNMPQTACSSVCVDYTNDSIIYLGTGDANYYGVFTCLGIWKTVDAGKTWTQSTSGLGIAISVDILMDPQDHNVLIAATNKGIWKSYNAGVTWTAKKSPGDFRNMVMKANAKTRTLYAVTGSFYYMSTDMGETWQQIALPYSGAGKGLRLAVTPADTNVVYIGMVLDGGTILRSTDGGQSFTTMRHDPNILLTGYDEGSPGQGDYNFAICADPKDANNIYLAAHCMWNSPDAGVTWTRQTSWYYGLHTDMHQIQFSPYETNKLFNANDGGVWLSTNGGTQWDPVSDGLGATECYHSAQSPVIRDLISIGTQDNGELYYTPSGWFTNRGGDWYPAMCFDANKDNNQVYYYGEGTRRDPINGFDQLFTPPVTFSRMEVNPLLPQTALLITNDVWRTSNLSNGNPTWTKITNFALATKDVYWSPLDSNVFYMLHNSGNKIQRSGNFMSAQPTFTEKVAPASIGGTGIIVSSAINPAKVYIVCGSKVYLSLDTCNTWADITGNLPVIPIKKFFLDPYSPHHDIYVLSSKGVYCTNDTMSGWINYSLGLPTVSTMKDFMIYCDSTKKSILRVSYYGRGVWERAMLKGGIVGIAEVPAKKELELNVFPNPSVNGTFNMHLNEGQPGAHRIYIYNVSGQQVYNEVFSNAASELNKTVNSAALSKGMYFVVLQMPNKQIARAKLLIQ